MTTKNPTDRESRLKEILNRIAAAESEVSELAAEKIALEESISGWLRTDALGESEYSGADRKKDRAGIKTLIDRAAELNEILNALYLARDEVSKLVGQDAVEESRSRLRGIVTRGIELLHQQEELLENLFDVRGQLREIGRDYRMEISSRLTPALQVADPENPNPALDPDLQLPFREGSLRSLFREYVGEGQSPLQFEENWFVRTRTEKREQQ